MAEIAIAVMMALVAVGVIRIRVLTFQKKDKLIYIRIKSRLAGEGLSRVLC